MVHGEKKSRTTNLDFPSVLLNQGLTEANNNTREETSFAFLHKQGGKKKGKKRRKERKQTVNIAESSTRRRLFARQHIPPQNNFWRERALHTTRETTRVYKNTITNDEIVTTPEENKHRSLFKRAKQREKEEKHFIERERSLKSARDCLDVPIDRIEEV